MMEEARLAAHAVPVATTSGALREPHTVLTMSVMDLVLFWFLFLYEGRCINYPKCYHGTTFLFWRGWRRTRLRQILLA